MRVLRRRDASESASWQPAQGSGDVEHIINDARIITRENIALCCCACNASKGQKAVVDWLQSTYCVKRGVSENTVAEIVKGALAMARNAPNQAIQRTAPRSNA